MNGTDFLEKYCNENWHVLHVILQSSPHYLLYIYSSVLATVLFPFPKRFLVGCVPIPERLRSLHCYPQTALSPSHFEVSQIKKNHLGLYLDSKVGGGRRSLFNFLMVSIICWQCEISHYLEGRKSVFLLFPSCIESYPLRLPNKMLK